MKSHNRITSAILALPFGIAMQSSIADPFSFAAGDTPLTIPTPPATQGTIVSTITAPPGSGLTTINDLNVFVDLDHTYVSDLDLIIEHVDTGTTALLFNQHGEGGMDITEVTFDDEGALSISSFLASPPYGPGSFIPHQPLDAFDGESLEGTWTLTILDNFSGDSGTLNTFRIEGDADSADFNDDDSTGFNGDVDGDGVEDVADLCPDTAMPEANVPSQGLKPNYFALVGAGNTFDTVAPPRGGNAPGATFTTTDTGGCSCEQILDAYDLGMGHYKFGCSVGIMKRWVAGVSK